MVIRKASSLSLNLFEEKPSGAFTKYSRTLLHFALLHFADTFFFFFNSLVICGNLVLSDDG